MLFLTLDLVREHLRLDADCGDERALTLYAESAEQEALNFMERSFDDLLDTYGEVPSPVVQACLLRVGTAYKNREEQTPLQQYYTAQSWQNLLMPYCKEV